MTKRTERSLWLALGLVLVLASAVIWSVASAEEIKPAIRSPADVEGGDPELGEDLIHTYGCGTCHYVPGVAGANGTVGPPLTAYALRDYVAGNLRNTPENLIAWIQNPQAIEPGTAMPIIGVSEEDARHIAAYLYTLDKLE